MAVVFISPKQRQKTFIAIIVILLVLFLVVLSLRVFSSKPREVPSAIVFNKAKTVIDMKIFNSDQFKNLQPFTEMEIRYNYKAVTKDNKQVIGVISAVSSDQASEMLLSMGLTASEIKEVEIGRDNPFVPYYSAAPVLKVKK